MLFLHCTLLSEPMLVSSIMFGRMLSLRPIRTLHAHLILRLASLVATRTNLEMLWEKL